MCPGIRVGRTTIGLGSSLLPYWTPQIPTGLTVTVISDTVIRLDWTNVDIKGDGAKIYISTDNVNFTYNSAVSLGVITTFISGLTANTLYYFYVVSYKSSAESDPSTVANVTTLEKWFLEGGIASANAIAAYTPVKKSTLALSYVNDANPGTYDAIAVTAPVLTSGLGWVFDAESSQVLRTTLVPVNDRTWSMIINYGSFALKAEVQGLAGKYEAGKIFHITLGKTGTVGVIFANGSTVTLSTSAIEGVIAFAGSNPYINSIDLGTINAGSGSATLPVSIGAICNGAGSYAWYSDCNIRSIAIYDKTLSVAELFGLQYRMNLLPKSNELLGKIRDYLSFGFGGNFGFSIQTFTNDFVDGDPNAFNPTDLDLDEWLDTAVTAGMGYVLLAGKDEKGWCNWPTLFADPLHDPYSIAQSAWYGTHGNYDILDNFLTKAKARGLGTVVYFSIYDATHEARTGTTEVTDPAAYKAMINTQLTEILTDYGDRIDALWFDDYQWNISYVDIPFKPIYDLIRSIQPNCLIIINDHLHPAPYSEIEEYESEVVDGHVAAGNIRPSEEIETMRTDGKWVYDPGDNQALQKDKATINAAVAQANSRTANYLLGLQPDRTGHLLSQQKTILESLQVP